MTLALLIGALATITGMAWLIHEALTAPYGWQDDATGFHYGIEPGNEVPLFHSEPNSVGVQQHHGD